MRDTYNTVNETISSLQTETIDEIMSQLADVNKSVVTLQHDIYDFLVDSNKAKMDIDDMKDDSQTQNQTIIAVIACARVQQLTAHTVHAVHALQLVR